MVAEWMIFANASVAERIYEAFPTQALLRRHPFPSSRKFEPVEKAAAAAGLDFDSSTTQSIAQSLQRVMSLEDPTSSLLIKILISAAMSEAEVDFTRPFNSSTSTLDQIPRTTLPTTVWP